MTMLIKNLNQAFIQRHQTALACLFILFTLFATPAMARQAVPIIQYDNIPIVSTQKLDTAQVLQAIKLGAASQHWVISNVENGALNATILVRQKHTVVVHIKYDTDKYSIHYQDSTNMKYEKSSDGQAIIHPFYNKWVAALNEAIRLELSKH